MKAQTKISWKGKPPKAGLVQFKDLVDSLVHKGHRAHEEGNLLDRPLSINDPPVDLLEITQAEIVEFSTAFYVFQLARADFEAKRAALTMKLVRGCTCEESSYFVSLDEQGKIVVEDHSSLEPITRRKIVDRNVVPSGGAA